jgi:hypothetical protein
MTSGDLKYLLQGLADDGAELVELDEERLVPRIRSRRRRRASLTAAVAASTAVMLAAGAYAVLPGGGQEQPPVTGGTSTPAPTMTTTSWKTADWAACGARLAGPLTGDPALRFWVAPHDVTRSTAGLSAQIGVKLVNTTGRTLDLTSGQGGPEIVVVKDGVVVAVPQREQARGRRWLFTPRQHVTLVTEVPLRRCDRIGSRTLDPGSYQLYALKTFNQNRRDYALVQLHAAGGPWTIELT